MSNKPDSSVQWLEQKIATTPTRYFCVWFVSGAEQVALGTDGDESHISQDLMVVAADCEEHAVAVAAELLRERCEFPAAITHVIDRADLKRAISVLDRVESGDLPPATMGDMDHYVWAERYLIHDSPLLEPPSSE